MLPSKKYAAIRDLSRLLGLCAATEELPLRIVDDFSSGPPFDTERLSGGMFRVRLLTDKTAIARDQD